MWLVLLLLAAGAWYGYSLWRHPYRSCWRCHGSKGHADPVARGAFGNCWACEGKGTRIRWGVLAFRRGTARQIRDGKHGRNF